MAHRVTQETSHEQSGADEETFALAGDGAQTVAVARKERAWMKFRKSDFSRNFKRNWTYLLFLIPAVVVTFIFAYIPIYGLLIAFQDYMPGDSILNGYWIQFRNFEEFFGNYVFWDLMGNTFLL